MTVSNTASQSLQLICVLTEFQAVTFHALLSPSQVVSFKPLDARSILESGKVKQSHSLNIVCIVDMVYFLVY